MINIVSIATKACSRAVSTAAFETYHIRVWRGLLLFLGEEAHFENPRRSWSEVSIELINRDMGSTRVQILK